MKAIVEKNVQFLSKKLTEKRLSLSVVDIVMIYEIDGDYADENEFDKLLWKWKDLANGFNNVAFIQENDPDLAHIKAAISDGGYLECIVVSNIDNINNELKEYFQNEFPMITVDSVHLT